MSCWVEIAELLQSRMQRCRDSLLATVAAVDSPVNDGHGFPKLAATPWRSPSSFPPPFPSHSDSLRFPPIWCYQRVSGHLGGDGSTGVGRRPKHLLTTWFETSSVSAPKWTGQKFGWKNPNISGMVPCPKGRLGVSRVNTLWRVE